MTTINSLYNQQVKERVPNYAKTVENYTSSLRAALRILYTFNDFSGFVESMQLAIERNLTAAWFAGAASCGVSQDEISDAEVNELFGIILRNFSFIAGFGADIIAGREQGETLTSFFPRINVWANRWGETRAIAQTLACGDQKLMWQLGVADHCEDCLRLNGKVKRASVWAASGIYPKMSTLACGGFNCKCSFVATNAPLTSGQIAPTLSVSGGIGGGLLGGALGSVGIAAVVSQRRKVAVLTSGTNIGDTFINLETGHGFTFGQTIIISEGNNSYTGTVFSVAPNVVEISPPLDFAFSINAIVTRG